MWSGKYPLILAIEQKNIALCRLLLELGSDPNGWRRREESHFSSIPLAMAARTNQPEIFELLITYGADPNRSRNGPPLCQAVIEGSVELTQRLIDLGADVNARSPHGQSPLRVALEKGNADHCQVLLAAGANLPTDAHVIAEEATRMGSVATMQAFQRRGIALTDAEHPHGTESGRAALDAAIKANRRTMAQYLLS